MTNDVVVVGGRCAGAPTAMLLARRAVRTAPGAIGPPRRRSVRPSDQAGRSCPAAPVELLDAVLATGCPSSDRVLWPDGQPHRPPQPEPGTGPIAPRRTELDPILLTAAAQAGVQVEMGYPRARPAASGQTSHWSDRRGRPRD
jgi:2-polyprenyl-6-methoxyphenol hydroxylase-like FAD-dependent oxidoreductase